MSRRRNRDLTAPEELRATVNLINNCRESFAESFTVDGLLALGRAYRACDWDITPDNWDPQQVDEAINSGYVPEWNDREEAIFPDTRKLVPL